MGDEEPPADAPPAEEEAPAAEAAAGPSVDDVKALSPTEAWDKHPQLKEAYDALEDKEGIVDQAEAAEGEEAPAPTWGEKAGDFLEANKDKFAAGDAPEVKKELKKVVITKEQWLATELKLRLAAGAKKLDEAALEKEWVYASEAPQSESKTKLDLFTKNQLNVLLDYCDPIDRHNLGHANHDWHKRVGHPGKLKCQVVWNKNKDYFMWEKSMGGPDWLTTLAGARWKAVRQSRRSQKVGGGFARAVEEIRKMKKKMGLATVVDEKFEDLVTELAKQSDEGQLKLEATVELPVAPNCDAKVGRNVAQRVLATKLYNAGITGFKMPMPGEEGQYVVSILLGEDEDTHPGPHGTEELVKKSLSAVRWYFPIKDLIRDCKAAQHAVAEAMTGRATALEQRAEKLKERVPESAEAAAPLTAFRSAAQEPMGKLREQVEKMAAVLTDTNFAEQLWGELPPGGGQRGYRVSAARTLRFWADAQHRAVTDALAAEFGGGLMASASEAGNATATCSITLPVVKTAEGPGAPANIGFAGAAQVLTAIVEYCVNDVALGPGAAAAMQGEGDEGAGTATFDVTVPLGTTPAA